MQRLFLTTGLAAALVLLTTCVVPLELETANDEKSPPRFLRDRCVPNFVVDLTSGSNDMYILTMVVQDPDVDDDIHYRIYRNYHECSDSSDPLECKSRFLNSGVIPPNGNTPLTQDGTRLLSQTSLTVREFNLPIIQSSFCDGSANSTNIIEVVIADAFDPISNNEPYWRATIGQSDVWSFVVNCFSGGPQKKRAASPKEENNDAEGRGR